MVGKRSGSLLVLGIENANSFRHIEVEHQPIVAKVPLYDPKYATTHNGLGRGVCLLIPTGLRTPSPLNPMLAGPAELPPWWVIARVPPYLTYSSWHVGIRFGPSGVPLAFLGSLLFEGVLIRGMLQCR